MYDTTQTINDLPPVDDSTMQAMQEQADQQAPEEPKEQQAEPTPQQQRFSDLRAAKARVERERDEAFRRLQELEAQRPSTQPEAEEEDLSIGADDIVEGKHYNQLKRHIKKLETQLKSQYKETLERSVEAQIKAQFPDFDQVVTKENIQALIESDPEIAESINANPDIYKKGVAAYKTLKKLGYAPNSTTSYEQERIKNNLSKPRATASISPTQGASPLSRANAFAEGLTPELQKQLLKEMNEAKKGY